MEQKKEAAFKIDAFEMYLCQSTCKQPIVVLAFQCGSYVTSAKTSSRLGSGW